jgi:hypothetical protein
MEVSGQLHAPACVPSPPPAERAPGTNLIGWVDSRGNLDALSKKQILSLLGIEPLLSNPCLSRYTDK